MLLPSAASPEDREFFTTGACHMLAVALHRMFGWRLHLVLDQGERYWENPEDEDDWIPAVIHVFAVDPDGNAWDIHGVRPLDEVRDEMEEMFYVLEYDSDELRSEDDLRQYVGCWAHEGDPIDRPLCEYCEADIEEAMELSKRIFSALPGFPPSAEVKP